ncbi:hypothetical protein M2102_001283 [Fusobacterium sp. PH5-7]|uniref:hypothetical protein n=1 Tax=Fusobacterium sp. PH5-7 TaxID=2940528 RepID=UPI00247671F2|nr:hypothetical protein [Fusobacterium sp. PH5-7]MDH6457655.1 hypothetical protein [Fusobacterium sp. PH5-7]
MKKDEFEKKIASEEIGIEDLLNSRFIKKYTLFNTYQEIEEEINNRATKSTDIEKLIKNIFLEKTKFRNIEDMKKKAIEEYLLYN